MTDTECELYGNLGNNLQITATECELYGNLINNLQMKWKFEQPGLQQEDNC